MKAEIALALGSNLGDRQQNLDDALAALAVCVEVAKRSPLYETAPQYVEDQPEFLNMAATGHTALSPAALLDEVKRIETALGRRPSVRFGPRLIDIDIIFFGDTVLDSERLTLPHPRLRERSFVLKPLADICPAWVDPVTGQTVRQLLNALASSDDIVLYDQNRSSG